MKTKRKPYKQIKMVFDNNEAGRCADCGLPVPVHFSFCDDCEQVWWEHPKNQIEFEK